MHERKYQQSARRALRAIWLLQGHVVEGLRLGAVAERLGTNPSSALRDLEALAEEGFAERIPGRTDHWRLTPKIVQLARATSEEFARHREAIAEFERRYEQG